MFKIIIQHEAPYTFAVTLKRHVKEWLANNRSFKALICDSKMLKKRDRNSKHFSFGVTVVLQSYNYNTPALSN